MKLVQETVGAFCRNVASESPAPGGGSVAALEGALGVSLTAMVCALTLGKKKYAEHEALAAENGKKAAALAERLLDVIDRDTEAFGGVSAVFAMPKATDEEKAARSAAMQAALKACTKTPYEMMELSCEALELTKAMVGHSNESAASDLGCAALGLKAALQGAWLNVLINIGGIRDEEFVSTYRAGGEALLARALPLADEIYEEIRNSL